MGKQVAKDPVSMATATHPSADVAVQGAPLGRAVASAGSGAGRRRLWVWPGPGLLEVGGRAVESQGTPHWPGGSDGREREGNSRDVAAGLTDTRGVIPAASVGHPLRPTSCPHLRA